MKVLTRFSTEPLFVVSIHVPRRDYTQHIISDHTTFMVLTPDGLHVVRESEAKVIDNRLDDFVYVNAATFDERVASFMWRPLAESGLWAEIVEFTPEGLRALRAMIDNAGLSWPA
jgi:hypothetical protein